jgi:DNA invertase Pin-like site-specific DNA recombinase
MNIAYIRTSTGGQDGQGQRKAILEYCASRGVKVDTWKEETVSSRVKKADREISRIAEGLQAGDTVIVSELSRLGRSSITEVFSIIESIRERGAGLEIVSEGLSIKPGKTDVKTEAVLSALSLAGRIERDMISERTKNALQARKGAGVKLGRPTGGSKLEKFDAEIQGYLDKKISKASIAKLLDVSRSTLYGYLKARENRLKPKRGREALEAGAEERDVLGKLDRALKPLGR